MTGPDQVGAVLAVVFADAPVVLLAFVALGLVFAYAPVFYALLLMLGGGNVQDTEPASGECLFGTTWVVETTVAEGTWEDGYLDAEGAEITATLGSTPGSTDSILTFPDGSFIRLQSGGDTLRGRFNSTNFDIDTSSVNWAGTEALVVRWEYGVEMSLDIAAVAFSDTVSLVGSGDMTGQTGSLEVGQNGGGNKWQFGSISCPRKL